MNCMNCVADSVPNDLWQERSFFINLLTKQCSTTTTTGQKGVCIEGIQVGSPGGDKFSVRADGSGGITVSNDKTGTPVSLPFHHDQFYIKDVTAEATVVDMEDIRVIFYQSGLVRVEADTTAFYDKVSFCSFLFLFLSVV